MLPSIARWGATDALTLRRAMPTPEGRSVGLVHKSPKIIESTLDPPGSRMLGPPPTSLRLCALSNSGRAPGGSPPAPLLNWHP